MSDKLQAFCEQQIKAFTAKLKKAAEEAIGEVECDYLPHLEGDFEMNAPALARRAVVDFLAGRTNELLPLTEYNARDVRIAIYREHKEEIIAAIGKDLEEEAAMWKRIAEERLTWARQ